MKELHTPMDGRFICDLRNETAKMFGVDFDCIPQIIGINKEILVLKLKGRTGWGGRGLQSYYPPEICVYKITKWITNTETKAVIDVEGLVEWETGRSKA